MMDVILDGMKYVLVALNLALFGVAVRLFMTQKHKKHLAPSTSSATKRALLVIAHPDDESMFFLPLVASLQDTKAQEPWKLHLLCLSNGNFDGLGTIREKELHSAAQFLGFSPQHVDIRNDPALQDGMQNQWDHEHIASIVTSSIQKHQIDAVFTFDDYGVSGHPNHIAVHHGVKRAIETLHQQCHASSSSSSVVRGWALQSTSLLRKYTGVLDTLVSMVEATDDRPALVFLFRPWWNYHAMKLHASQFVWYRRLFVVFSRYTFLNTFRLMENEDKKSQ